MAEISIGIVKLNSRQEKTHGGIECVRVVRGGKADNNDQGTLLTPMWFTTHMPLTTLTKTGI